MLQQARDDVLLPTLDGIATHLRTLAHTQAAQPMLSRTHGQTASPTTLGKEIANVVARFGTPAPSDRHDCTERKDQRCCRQLQRTYHQLSGGQLACTGMTFVESLGLVFNPCTTQIEPHDTIAEISDAIRRANTILIDLARDLWGYISLGSSNKSSRKVKSAPQPCRTKSIRLISKMPRRHFRRPIALFEHFSTKLPISRWQRDSHRFHRTFTRTRHRVWPRSTQVA